MDLVYLIIFYIIVNILAIFTSENIAYNEWNSNQLYDIIHNNMNEFPNPNMMIYIVLSFIFYFVLKFRKNTRILKIFLKSMILILSFRILTFSFTQTPPPIIKDKTHHCKRNLFSNFNISFKDNSITCIDNMFSGHSSHIVVTTILILLYSKNNFEKYIIPLIASISLFFIISSRLHYTSDVIVAIIISTLTTLYFMKKK